MAITSAASLASASGAGTTTLAVTATAVNDLWVVYVSVGGGITCTGVSGGNASSWTQIVNNWTDGYGSNESVWIGTMTSTGSATITATFSGSVSGQTVDIDAQPFHSSLGVPSWSADGNGHLSNSSNTTVTFATLIPSSGRADLYWGHAAEDNAPSGPSSGYTLATDVHGNAVIYNVAVSASTSPTCSQSPAGLSSSVSVLVSDAPPVNAFYAVYPKSGKRPNVGPMALRRQQVQLPYSLPPVVNVNAGLAIASAVALAATPSVGATAGLASASGAAFSPTPSVGVNAGLAQAAVAALGSVIAITVNAGVARAGGTPQPVTVAAFVPSPWRIAFVAPEIRSYRVPRESRVAPVAAENRSVRVPPQGG